MIIETIKDFAKLVIKLDRAEAFVVDTETTGLLPYHGDRVIGISFFIPTGPTSGKAYYLPYRHKVGKNLPVDTMRCLLPVLSNPLKRCFGWNLKFDAEMLLADNLILNNQWGDVMLAAHLVNENEMNYKLKHIADRYVDDSASEKEKKLNDLLRRTKDRVDADYSSGSERHYKQYMQYLPAKDIADYAEEDARLPWYLWWIYEPLLEKENLTTIWQENNEYAKVIMRMEHNGVRIDPQLCSKYSDNANKMIKQLTKKMQSAVGKPFNPNSAPQLQRILGIPSTNKTALKVCKHPIAPILLQYRAWLKAETSYYAVFLKGIDENDRIHSSFHVIGTISGRLSCKEPNLQALPRVSSNADIYKVRDLVVAPRGKMIVSLDYNQIELRVLAHYTKDDFLMGVYKNNKDIHAETAAIMGVDRHRAKVFNYCVIYGIGAKELALQFNTPQPKAQILLNRYYTRVPTVRSLYYHTDKVAQKEGHITMWTGRRRHYDRGSLAETWKAMSNLIQGGVAEIVRKATIKVAQALVGTEAKLILNVHDELLFEIPIPMIKPTVKMLEEIMQDYKFNVPIVVESKAGNSWGALQDLQDLSLASTTVQGHLFEE